MEDLKFAEYDDRRLFLDIHLPDDDSSPAPLIVSIPVGGWRKCVRKGERHWLTEFGFAVAVIECRLPPDAIAPAAVHDCKSAVRWLRAHGAEYGLAVERIGTLGSSAGGHLSAMMAVSGVSQLEGDGGNADVSSAVQAACDMRGPSDLERMADPALAQANPVLCEVTEGFLGGPVAEHRDLARLMSPLRHVSSNAAPLLILHGDEDATVPVAESELLHAALQEAGADSSLTILPGQGHGWDNDLTLEQTVAFFRRTLT